MTEYFEKLVAGYNSANNEVVKGVLYDAMAKYAEEYHPGYVCYDMDMYVALYKCATTPKQRKCAWDYIRSIIIDDSFQFHSEIIENFKEYLSLKDFLKGDPLEESEFDSLCIMVLDFFEKQLKWAKDLAKCGQADFYPDVSISEIEGELKEVRELVVSTGMSNLDSYKKAYQSAI